MRRSEKGMTLVEILVALVLLGFGLLAVAPMFVYAMRENRVGSDIGTAGAAAVAVMERLREMDFDDPELNPGGSLSANVTSAGVDYFDASDPDIVVRWQVASHPPVAGTKVVTVRAIALRPTVGRPKAATLTTIRGE